MDAETLTGERLSDEDPFVAGVPGIDIVKFDGRATAPALTGGTVIGVLILVALTGGGLLLFLIGRRRRTVHAIAQ